MIHMSQNKKALGFKISFQMIIWIAIIVFFAYISYLNIIKLNNIKSIQASVQKEIDAENDKTAELREQLEYQESDAFYEKVAREQLGLVMPDEIILYKK